MSIKANKVDSSHHYRLRLNHHEDISGSSAVMHTTRPSKDHSTLTNDSSDCFEQRQEDTKQPIVPNHHHLTNDDFDTANEPSIEPTKKRYFILLMFVVLCALKSFQWVCFASITNVISKFYHVDNIAINWTAIVFMVTFLVLALPVSWVMEQIGLRNSVLIGSLGTTLGVVIKCFSCYPEGYYLSMLGHLLVGLSEPFFFSIYSQISSVWFPDNQVSLATSIGLLGEEIGIALGFIIPSLVVGNDINDEETIQQGLFLLFLGAALLSVMNTSSIALFFDEQPRKAPGVARFKQIHEELLLLHKRQQQTLTLEKRKRNLKEKLLEQLKQLQQFLMNKDFDLLLIGFGLNVGTNYSIRTILNQMIVGAGNGGDKSSSSSISRENDLTTMMPIIGVDESQQHHWDDVNLVVGNAGLILIVAGFFGTVVCGHLLDKFHCYKLTTALTYLFTHLTMLALTYCLRFNSSQFALYTGCALLGFFITGYLCCGFEYGVEITYPKSELTSSTLLNISAQIFGIPLSLAGSAIVDAYGNQAVGLFFAFILLLGFLLACLQNGKLRRQNAVESSSAAATDSSTTTTATAAVAAISIAEARGKGNVEVGANTGTGATASATFAVVNNSIELAPIPSSNSARLTNLLSGGS